jgi:hypothetical protein
MGKRRDKTTVRPNHIEEIVRDYVMPRLNEAESMFAQDKIGAAIAAVAAVQLILPNTEFGRRSNVLDQLIQALEHVSLGHPDPFFAPKTAPRSTRETIMFQAFAAAAMELRWKERKAHHESLEKAATWVSNELHKAGYRFGENEKNPTAAMIIGWRKSFKHNRRDRRSKGDFGLFEAFLRLAENYDPVKRASSMLDHARRGQSATVSGRGSNERVHENRCGGPLPWYRQLHPKQDSTDRRRPAFRQGGAKSCRLSQSRPRCVVGDPRAAINIGSRSRDRLDGPARLFGNIALSGR